MGSTEDYYYNEYLPNEIKKRKEQMVGKDEEPWTALRHFPRVCKAALLVRQGPRRGIPPRQRLPDP